MEPGIGEYLKCDMKNLLATSSGRETLRHNELLDGNRVSVRLKRQTLQR